MKITITSVPVNNQDNALKFYTEILGFITKTDIPMGGEHRWLTVVSPEDPDGVELLLEPLGFPPSATYQKELFDAGIPYTSFGISDVQKEYERLEKMGVIFKKKPVKMGPTIGAEFEDTCGNIIQMYQV